MSRQRQLVVLSQSQAMNTAQESWLAGAAEEGHMQAIYDYATECEDEHLRQRLLSEAANRGFCPAIKATAARRILR